MSEDRDMCSSMFPFPNTEIDYLTSLGNSTIRPPFPPHCVLMETRTCRPTLRGKSLPFVIYVGRAKER